MFSIMIFKRNDEKNSACGQNVSQLSENFLARVLRCFPSIHSSCFNDHETLMKLHCAFTSIFSLLVSCYQTFNLSLFIMHHRQTFDVKVIGQNLLRSLASNDEKQAKPNKPDVLKVMELNGKLNFCWQRDLCGYEGEKKLILSK